MLTGIIIGLILGSFVTVFALSLCAMASKPTPFPEEMEIDEINITIWENDK